LCAFRLACGLRGKFLNYTFRLSRVLEILSGGNSGNRSRSPAGEILEGDANPSPFSTGTVSPGSGFPRDFSKSRLFLTCSRIRPPGKSFKKRGFCCF
jgi:hypothetical protein